MIVKLEEDPETGDLILPLNEEICKAMGVQIGDDLTFESEDGVVKISKSKKTTKEQEVRK